MLKPVLINKPDLTVIVPSPAASNNYLSFEIPADSVTSIAITPTADPSMQVDNTPVCTKLSISISGKSGMSAYSDSITVTGESIATTVNNSSLILQGQTKTGLAGSTVFVKSCGQTSTTAD